MHGQSSATGGRASFKQVMSALATRTRRLAPGAFLYRQNDICDGVYLLKSGEVELLVESASRVRSVRHFKSGSIIGLPESLNGSNRSASARAIVSSTVCNVPLDALTEALRQDPALCLMAANVISEEIRCTVNLLKHLHSSRTRSKITKLSRL